MYSPKKLAGRRAKTGVNPRVFLPKSAKKREKTTFEKVVPLFNEHFYDVYMPFLAKRHGGQAKKSQKKPQKTRKMRNPKIRKKH